MRLLLLNFLKNIFLFTFFFSGLLSQQLCWYLTCDRHLQFEGESETSKSDTSNRSGLTTLYNAYLILVILASILSTVLIVLYYVVWLCFYQMEEKQTNAGARTVSYKFPIPPTYILSTSSITPCFAKNVHLSQSNYFLKATSASQSAAGRSQQL